MRNDSIESLMRRHYGSTAHTPAGLEQRLHASVHDTVVESQRQQQAMARILERRVSRRQVIRLVAPSNAGPGILNLGLEALQVLEDVLVGQETTGTAYP